MSNELIKCSSCGTEISSQYLYCVNCGEQLIGDDDIIENTDKIEMDIVERYPALRAISTIYKIIAFLSLLVGTILEIVVLSRLSGEDYYSLRESGEIATIILPLIYGVLAFISCLAIAEGIHLFIDIESNTRKNNLLIEKILQKK